MPAPPLSAFASLDGLPAAASGGGIGPGAWQLLFFAALGAWLVSGAVRSESVPAAPTDGPADGAASGVARPGYLAAVGATLLFSAAAACWGLA